MLTSGKPNGVVADQMKEFVKVEDYYTQHWYDISIMDMEYQEL